MIFHVINMSFDEYLRYHLGMDKGLSPFHISVSVTVLSQMFLYLTWPKVGIDNFLRSVGVDLAIVKPPDAYIPIDKCSSRIKLHITRMTRTSVYLWESMPRPAQKYRRKSYSVEYTTYLLGFIEPSAFSRAIKNCLWATPKGYQV